MKCMAWKWLIFSKIWIKRSHIKGIIPQLELYKSFSPKSRAKLPTKAELVVILVFVESANIPSVDSSLLVAASPSTGSGEAGIHSSLWRQIAFHSLCNCFTMANLTTSFRTFSMETRISLLYILLPWTKAWQCVQVIHLVYVKWAVQPGEHQLHLEIYIFTFIFTLCNVELKSLNSTTLQGESFVMELPLARNNNEIHIPTNLMKC